ncbi:M28 family peptidase [Nonlabens ulvanivorans]|uniref:M28 family peptidase n=2 Tax=Nonlabens ulvanivorans TaxID=906888 RepID=UPI0032664DFA
MRSFKPKSHLSSALSFLTIIAIIWYVFYSQTPSAAVEDSLPATEWSTARALEHVKAMSVQPHHVGSAAHDDVRDYVVTQLQAMGLQVTTQKGYTMDPWGNLANPENILARIKGSQDNSKALLLLSHYDSDPHSSKGASDAASGVATILEGVRTFLAQNKQPLNDIIICITDAEELGLNGAELFVNEHPWAQDVAMVLNFEARGSGGPSYMLVETNGGNRKIIEEFSNAGVEYPVANSLAYSIYKMIPNDTDLTVFRKDGDINGLNFAFIGDHYDYHTELDNYERLDRNTLAHQGAYLMPLMNHLSNIDLSDELKVPEGDDYVYFPMPIIKMVSFPFKWLPFLIIGSGLLLVVLIVYGIRKRRISFGQILAGFVPFLGSLIIGYLLSNYGWVGIKSGSFYVDQQHGFSYNGYWLIAAAAMTAATLCFFLYHKYYKKDNVASLSIAPLFILWLVCLLIAFPVGDGGLIPGVFLPGAGFFLVPLIAGLLMVWLNINQRRPSYILLVILAVPALFIFTPFVKAFPVALGMGILFVAAILTTLLIGLLIPIIGHYRRKDLLSFIGLIATLVCVGYAFAKAEFTPSQPQSTSLVYIQNQDDQTAQWATYDEVLTDWTKAKLGESPAAASELNKNTIDSKYGTGFSYAATAPYKELAPVRVETLIDSLHADLRTVKMKIYSESVIQRLEVFCDTTYVFEDGKVNGREVYKAKVSKKALPNRWGNRMLSYYVTNNEPLELELTFKADVEPEFQFYAASFDLLKTKALDVKPRPLEQMSMPFVLNDAILRKRYVTLNRPTVVTDSIPSNE